MIFLRRISKGIASHFDVRVSEWVMVIPCIGIGIALNLQRTMFETSPSFARLNEWMDEPQWALLAITCAILRVVALTVNGTFEAFRFSPHIRILAAFFSGWFWFQFMVGFALSAVYDGGSFSGPVVYSTLFILEAVNAYRASKDFSASRR